MSIVPDRPSSSVDSQFECDVGLPVEGLELETKALLIDLIDSVNGIKAVSRQSRLLQKWCTLHPKLLGTKGSIRHMRVRYLVGRWKQNDNYSKAKKTLATALANANNDPLLPIDSFQEGDETTNEASQTTTCTGPACSIKPKAAAKSKTIAKQPQVKSPPVIKKKVTTTTMSKPFGSPLRLFGVQTEKKGLFNDMLFPNDLLYRLPCSSFC